MKLPDWFESATKVFMESVIDKGCPTCSNNEANEIKINLENMDISCERCDTDNSLRFITLKVTRKNN